MAVFKCKMCGGTLEVNNETVAVCQYCGTKQTLPKLDDDRKANLYDRANHFRRNNEFDKAMGIYEQILNDDNTDAETYWSLVLCRYGIEYVEDPSSRKRIPTVNRAQFTSIFDDEDYKSALQYADGYQKDIYEHEATAINDIQKGILAISSQEEPFDVFICYKETDNNGRRTPDSVLATELYHELTREGYKVFFSRITLEDKLGSAYEPYIFAALNSAKVMIVLGTKPEFFNAVWVKNEWSRYLALIKNGARKMLIPAYKDMDPYDLPEEFSHLQAQDMSKLGFIQDLIRGIKKVVDNNTETKYIIESSIISKNSDFAPLLKRAFIFLEDGDWNSGNEYCEKVLDIDPENAIAYLGKLMAELRVRNQETLKEQAEPFDNRNNFQKAIRFGDENLKATLNSYIEHINIRNEKARLNSIYNKAKEKMSISNTEIGYKETAKLFESLDDYLDAANLAQKCYEKAEISWQETKKRKEFIKKIAIITTPVVCAVFAFIIILNTAIIPNNKYNNAIALMGAEKYGEAVTVFESLSGYKDSQDKILECKYHNAIALMSEGKYTEAITSFEALKGYKDSEKQIENCFISKYGVGIWDEIKPIRAAKTGDTIFFGAYEQDNDISNGKEKIEWIVLDKKETSLLLISKKALDRQYYNSSNSATTWETCTLRRWLNNDFINSAFSKDERAMIPTVMVSADENPDYYTNPGNSTQDRVFLLSISEANKYFSSDAEKLCKSTNYAALSSSYNGNSWWWLRSPGCDQFNAAYVYTDGSIYTHGALVNGDHGRDVRPAIWVDPNK